MTTITIDRRLLEHALAAIQELEYADTAVSDKKARDAKQSIRAALAAPATALNDRLRNESKRKPMTDQDTLDLFNRIQLRMRFTDADARPFASGVASAEFFHGIKGTP